MDIGPDDTVVVELDCDEWPRSYSRVLAWRQLGELLLKFDELADATEGAQ
ncbi:hypothetical protein [Streptomyces bambusae]|uniref:Uncharacterized protein n=1 Tax=Streptomyces bambusae TaxID=1550616 RepID=A0ABS6ZDC5_9ACTN|nr:hypothetical protein [Streptomyces bambusae]MBW5485726.1 hypothetical protein [Streptomyces bambusae]